MSKNSVRMRILPLTHDQRAFGFDRRVLQLNCQLLGLDCPGPNLVSRVVHSVVHPLKEAVRAVFVCAKSLVRRPSRGRTDEEADTSEGKSAAEIATDEYRRKLEHTFGSSGNIERVMAMGVVMNWTNGE